MFKRYPQLQSGYLIGSEDMVTKPTTPPTTPASTLLNRVPTRTQQDLFFVPEIERVVNLLIQEPLKIKDFKVQEEVLAIIGKVFAKQGFAAFVRLQAENPGISMLHKEFLKETVELVTRQREQRSVSLQTWASLISAANPSMGAFNPQEINVYFNEKPNLGLLLDAFITEWVRVVGWSDLIISLQVLFGRRSLHGIQGGTY